MTLDAAKLTAIEWRSPEWLAMYGPLRRENVLDYFSLSPFWDTGCKNANLRMQMRVQLQQQQQQQQQQQMHPGGGGMPFGGSVPGFGVGSLTSIQQYLIESSKGAITPQQASQMAHTILSDPFTYAAHFRDHAGIEYEIVHEVPASPPPGMPPQPGMPVHGAQFVIQKQQRTSAREPARPLAVFYVINDCIYMAPDLYSVVSNRIRSVANCVKTGFELASQAVEYSIADGYSWRFDDTLNKPSKDGGDNDKDNDSNNNTEGSEQKTVASQKQKESEKAEQRYSTRGDREALEYASRMAHVAQSPEQVTVMLVNKLRQRRLAEAVAAENQPLLHQQLGRPQAQLAQAQQQATAAASVGGGPTSAVSTPRGPLSPGPAPAPAPARTERRASKAQAATATATTTASQDAPTAAAPPKRTRRKKSAVNVVSPPTNP